MTKIEHISDTIRRLKTEDNDTLLKFYSRYYLLNDGRENEYMEQLRQVILDRMSVLKKKCEHCSTCDCACHLTPEEYEKLMEGE